MNAWRAAAAGCLLFVLASSTGWTAEAMTSSTVGKSIYLFGTLGSGAPLQATRDDANGRTQGEEVACVKCHRRSGLGASEGLLKIPPITGRYLFHSRHAKFDEVELPYVENARANRDAYTDATLARAIRQGIDSDGDPLGYLMPRFALSDADMASLIAYLKGLNAGDVPGVTNTLLHFATIITPDADAVKRSGMLDVLQHYFSDKNAFPFGPSPHMRSSGKTLYAKSMYLAQRHWQLHVWQLTGPAATWAKQLAHHLAEEPVLAAVSGLGASNWAPVHEFCERARLPCLFPNVEVPRVDDQDFYTLYFSRGVLLEADLIAERIRAGEGQPSQAVLQIYRGGDSGAAAAAALASALRTHGIAVRSHVLPAGSPGQHLADALREASTADTLVLWLRPGDVAALGEAHAAPATVYLSGIMGGLESSPLPVSWRGRTRIAYPFDLPDRSRVRVEYPLEWFSIRHIPVVAPQVQVDTYLACGVLAETLSHMADTFVPEYLVERAEELLGHRVMTGPYPRLSLAEGQRFASKGGYIVQFAGADGTKVIADREWTVPE
jgi:hypothetical protein